MKTSLFSLFSLFLISGSVDAQNADTLRVMTYNLLNYSSSSADERLPHFKRILENTNPSILVTQGNVDSFYETLFFLALPSGEDQVWGISDFMDGPDTDPICYYDAKKLKLVASHYIQTELRNIGEYHLVTYYTRDTIIVFSCHLKDGNELGDRNQRLREIQSLQRRMDSLVRQARSSSGQEPIFIITGDLNVYTSSEDSYQNLLLPSFGTGIAIIDPLNKPGGWSGNADFASIHTQSSRVRQFAGGSGGGMNARFDQILISPNLASHYLAGSYTTYGNDGLHFNDSINRLPNLAVPDSIAQSLHDASDHLPVYADFVFVQTSNTVRELKAPLIAVTICPQPASDLIMVRIQSSFTGPVLFRLVNASGQTILEKRELMIQAGESQIELDVQALPSGVYGYSLDGKTVAISGKVVLMK